MLIARQTFSDADENRSATRTVARSAAAAIRRYRQDNPIIRNAAAIPCPPGRRIDGVLTGWDVQYSLILRAVANTPAHLVYLAFRTLEF